MLYGLSLSDTVKTVKPPSEFCIIMCSLGLSTGLAAYENAGSWGVYFLLHSAPVHAYVTP